MVLSSSCHESDSDYFLLYSWFLQGHVEQWIDFATLEIDTNILRWFIPRIGFAVYLPPVSFCYFYLYKLFIHR